MRQENNSSDLSELFKKCFLKIRYPLLIPALICSAGTLASFKFSCAAEILIIIGVFVLTVSVILKIKLRNFIGFILCIACAFSVKSFENNNRIADNFKDSEISGSFLITELVSRSNYERGQLKVLSVKSGKLESGSKVSFFAKSSFAYSKGDIISGKLIIKNGLNNKYRNYNISNGSLYETFINKDIKRSGRNIIYSSADKAAKYIASLTDSYTDKDASATILGIMLGDKTGFTDEFYSNIRHSGVSHVMVVSGMHLAIIMGSVRAFTKKFGLNKYLEFIITNGFLLFFMAVCGFTQSVMRAGIMYIILSLSGLLNREGDSINALCLAVMIILIRTPYAVLNISFQLSVLSTLGILYSSNTVSKFIKIKPKPLKALADSALTSVSALLFTLPVVIYKFGEFSVVSVITNLLISYAVTAVLTLMLAVTAISLIPFSGVIVYYLFKILQILADYLNSVINYLGSRSYSFIKCSDKAVAFAEVILLVFLIICAGYKFMFYIKNNSLKSKDEKECRLSLKAS